MVRGAIITILALMLVACGSRPESTASKAAPKDPFLSVVGKWADKPKDARVAIQIDPDKQFTATFVIGKNLSIVKGKATLAGDKLELEPVKINGRAPGPAEQKKETMKLSSDGLALTSGSGKVLSKRIPSPTP